MFANNPFSILAESVSPILMQSFVILMGLLVIAGTLMDIIHKKNVKYFFNNAKKAKKSATKNLTTGERISVISKTIASDTKKKSLFYRTLYLKLSLMLRFPNNRQQAFLRF